MPGSMSKISALFRCPLEDYGTLEAISKANGMEVSRCVLYAVLMLVDAWEAESSARAKSAVAAGSGPEEESE